MRRVPDRLATCSRASPPNPDQERFEQAIGRDAYETRRALRASADGIRRRQGVSGGTTPATELGFGPA
jgi:hypothetical protein